MKKRILWVTGIIIAFMFLVTIFADSTGLLTYIYRPTNPLSELTSIYIDTDGSLKATDSAGVIYNISMANQTSLVITAIDSTPDVTRKTYFTLPSATGTYITDFDNGEAGQNIIIKGSNTAGTIRFGTNIFGYTDSLQLDTMDIASFFCDGTDWFLTGYSIKGNKPENKSSITIIAASGDGTPSVLGNNLFRLSSASSTVITDFDDGIAGQRITVLGSNQAQTVTVGTNIFGWNENIVLDTLESLELYSDGTSWYIEGYYMNNTRAEYKSSIVTATALDNTPSVLGETMLMLSPASATTITDFDDGVVGQKLRVIGTNQANIITFGTNIIGWPENVTMDTLQTMDFVCDGTLWRLTGFTMDGTNPYLASSVTVLASNATPTVLGKTNFAAPAAAQTITGFTNGVVGQVINVAFTAEASTLDFTSSNLQGHAADLVPANLDMAGFIYVGSDKWNLLYFNDASSSTTY